MKTSIRRLALLSAVLLTACDDPGGNGPNLSVVGQWDMIGFSDAGIDAATTGTLEFRSNGTVSWIGTITFPGEPTDSIVVDGTYAQARNTLTLTFGSDPATAWTPELTGDVLVLTAIEAPPPNVITLRRP
jgi:hypothetical protein